MSDLVAYVAVIGRLEPETGIWPVRLELSNVECLVSHGFPNYIEESTRGINVDTGDCTVFEVRHPDRGDLDLMRRENVKLVFEQSLSAISEVLIWTKSHSVGEIPAFIRQIGTTDIKAFFLVGASETRAGWLNPAFTFDRQTAAKMAGMLSNMIVSNGPSANPIPPVTRRVMSSLDLINLGFHTESFVNLFSLVDDLTQEVIKAGMTERGLNADEQKALLRSIKEERLKVYLCNLSKLCGWQSLEEADKSLYDRVIKVNSVRNNIMHGSRRLLPAETIETVNTLLALIDWLRSNPFGFTIPQFPLLSIAEPQFVFFPIIESDSASKEDHPPPAPPAHGG